MAPTATPQTIVISPDTRLVTIQNPVKMSRVEVTGTNNVPNLPKYAVGLFDSNGQGPRKRKRLTHLTPEEKIMRRKLKNRVAAQTARDRKKIRMECLEETINKVQEQAKQLLDVNIKLLERAEALERENSELKTRLGLTTETSSTVTQDRLDVERIKMEFDETMLSNDNANMSLPESLLSPDESSDENDSQGSLKRKVFDFQCLNDAKRQCLTTTERASSEPAAGSCQADADPLDGGNASVDLATSCTETNESKDILGLLEQIDASLDSNALIGSFTADQCIGSEQQVTKPVTVEQIDSIKELINFDHHYSKPRVNTQIRRVTAANNAASKPVQVQLSRSSRLTKLIRQHSNLSEEDQKPTALCEKTASNETMPVVDCTSDSEEKKPAELNLPPMLCPVKQETDLHLDDSSESSSILDFDNLDAELDLLLNPNMESKDTLSLKMPKPEVEHSNFSMLETPTTLADEFCFNDDLESFKSCLSDATSAELFPQLASFVF
uniref:X-box-binding protein 1 n=1 Tax=Phallusia mammillata TaxID=59560 RepID=A0A6F9DX85_9ASCI|nr:xBPa X-box-binding protein [Phallusia mammillata]